MSTTDAGLGLQYNAPSMLQQIAWALGAPCDDRSLILEEAGTIMDPCAYQARNFASSDEALQARAALRDELGAQLRSSTVIVFTFGLTEVWTDRATGVACNVTPPASVLGAEPDRYRCHRLTHAENLSAMRSIFQAVRSVNRAAGIIATISPVPLAATFLGPDVLQANSYSKSTLRSALGEAIAWALADGLGPIDYFPSYELVTLTDRAKVWREESPDGKPDGRHVLPGFVREVIIGCFASAYLGSAKAAIAEAAPNG